MDLEQRLARAIAQRAGGRLTLSSVQVVGGRVVLRGLADSYHAIQLAYIGLLETFNVLQLDRPDKVDLNIDVVPIGSQLQGPAQEAGEEPN